MAESLSEFPFRKLRYVTYLTLDVMMYVDHPEVYKFMFTLNKEARKFLQDKFITIRNGFINDGLITYELGNDFMHYQQLENLYFQALKRIPANRVITFQVSIHDQRNLAVLNEVVRWINAQQQQIKLQLKVHLNNNVDSHEKLNEFLDSFNIIELKLDHWLYSSKKLSFNETLYNSLRCLNISFITKIDLQCFKSLQILSFTLGIKYISKVISYLASKFNRDHFKKMQINLDITKHGHLWIEDQKSLDQYVGILPKHIQIDAKEIDLDEIKVILETFEPSIVSLNDISVNLFSNSNFKLLETLSKKAKKVRLIYEKRDQKLMIEEYHGSFESITDHLTIMPSNQIPLKMINIFQNIKSIYDSWSTNIFPEINYKITLPKLQSLQVHDIKQLVYYTGLKLLTKIRIHIWDHMIDLDDIFDPSKILYLELGSIKTPQVLSLFKNLRSLKFYEFLINENQIYQFLPQLKDLRSLKFIYHSKETLYQFCNIYKDCRSLATFEIQQGTSYFPCHNQGCIEFIENMIQQIKQNQYQRSSPLTLIFSNHLTTIAEVRIMKMIEQDSFVSQQLQLQFAKFRGIDVKKVISEIDLLKHPILHKFLSNRAEIYGDWGDDDY